MPEPTPLSADQLCRRCNPDDFDFSTTEELEDLKEIIGQDRAMEALQFGVGIQREGYNLFVLGPPGIGKHSVVRQYLGERAKQDPIPSDYCYINNFYEPHKPKALRLPAGMGVALRKDMAHLIEDLRNAIPVAFEAEEYHARVREIEEGFKERREKALTELAQETEKEGLALIRTPGGFAFAPEKDGEVIKAEEYEKLSDEEKKRIEAVVAALQDKLSNILHQTPKWQRESREQIKELEHEVAHYAIGHLIDEIRRKYADFPEITTYLEAVGDDIIQHLGEFRGQEEAPTLLGISVDERPSFRRYEVNVLVDHSASTAAPIVYEDSPVYQNLVGRVEHLAHMGALVTDFTLVKAGALHRANGGYLMLDATKVLMQPYAWEGLKRILFSGQIRIESLGQIYSLVSTVSIDPEPIPLNVKVILLGDRLLYYLLCAYDPDFSALFKVAADFEDDLARSVESELRYARLLATLARRNHIRPLDRKAVARVIDHSARLSEHSSKLSTHLLQITDLLRESDHFAAMAGNQVIGRSDVDQAIGAQIHRGDRIRMRTHEYILDETIMIDSDGERIGQVNGLSVIDLGNVSFGQPSRITATVRLGEGEFVDIEREVELGGAIHSKGVLILSSYISKTYASNKPLSLSASLVFEQSYGMIEGDSASVGELCALLSAIAETPVRQQFAITGSVNQHGQVQAIGGVNEKIEGFFDICAARGLTGRQGVIIPAANVKHLMLKHEVVEAAGAGNFGIYAIQTVDEAIEILTGIAAGHPDADGNFPSGTINDRVEQRLERMADLRIKYSKPTVDEEDD